MKFLREFAAGAKSSTSLFVAVVALTASSLLHDQSELDAAASAIITAILIAAAFIVAKLEELLCEVKGLRADWVDEDVEGSMPWDLNSPWPDTGERVEHYQAKEVQQ